MMMTGMRPSSAHHSQAFSDASRSLDVSGRRVRFAFFVRQATLERGPCRPSVSRVECPSGSPSIQSDSRPAQWPASAIFE